jgi:DNA polymerase III subunit gamma/tau
VLTLRRGGLRTVERRSVSEAVSAQSRPVSHPIAIVTAMATQSLYRRYRPRRFSEVKGQDHVVRALRTAVAEGREGQAYLFSGPRGTGKTSSARILAKVLNCERPEGGEPCCECESCLSVERGTSYDVHELDAASNNGVDAMRDLIEKASLGTPGRHKVYILDEVHMLSKAAEAALLKTLEEPPPHVVFVLATTDPQKMSDTIRSRTQHLQFHLLPTDTLLEHVRWVAHDAGLDISDAAVEQVLAQGGGSARDALSALELAASTGDEGIQVVPLDEYVDAMIDRDPGRALTMVAHAISLGRDPRTLTEELVAYLRNGFLSLMAPELVQVPSSRLDGLAEQSQRLGAPAIVRGIETLGAALTEMRHAPDPRVLLDVATVQLTADSVAPDLIGLLTRLDRLEQQMAGIVDVASPGISRPAVAPVDPATGRATLGGRARQASPAATRRPASPAPADPAAGASAETVVGDAATALAPEPSAPEASAPEIVVEAITVEAITVELWENTVRPALRGMARAVYAPASYVRSTASSLTLSVPNAVHLGKCEEHRAIVESALTELLGAAVSVELITAAGSPGVSTGAAEHESPAAGVDVSSDDDDIDDIGDLDDLVDAPPESVRSPIDRLAEAFPGSELIEEPR